MMLLIVCDAKKMLSSIFPTMASKKHMSAQKF